MNFESPIPSTLPYSTYYFYLTFLYLPFTLLPFILLHNIPTYLPCLTLPTTYITHLSSSLFTFPFTTLYSSPYYPYSTNCFYFLLLLPCLILITNLISFSPCLPFFKTLAFYSPALLCLLCLLLITEPILFTNSNTFSFTLSSYKFFLSPCHTLFTSLTSTNITNLTPPSLDSTYSLLFASFLYTTLHPSLTLLLLLLLPLFLFFLIPPYKSFFSLAIFTSTFTFSSPIYQNATLLRFLLLQ